MGAFEGIVNRIEQASSLDPIAGAMRKVSGLLTRNSAVRDGLAGTWLGHPVHPLMIVLPLGAWSSALVLDMVGGKSSEAAARKLVATGVVAAAPTAIAGAADWHYTQGPESRVGVVHAALNFTALTFFAASWAKRANGSGKLAALVGAAAVGAGGYLGGHLSYARGVGVDNTVFEDVDTDWRDVCDLPREGGLTRVEVDNVGVVVANHGGQVSALFARCNHRGGPLDEGEITGSCVRCPWHGSRFELSDGSVTEGPATRPQPYLQARVVDGRVQVRSKPS